MTTPRRPVRFGNQRGSKYGNRRAYSPLCGRTFDSLAELRYGEQLFLRQQAGEIVALEYQPAFILRALPPRVSYRADFRYREVAGGRLVVVDVKGVLTPAGRIKLAWLLEKQPDVRVTLLRLERDGSFREVDW